MEQKILEPQATTGRWRPATQFKCKIWGSLSGTILNAVLYFRIGDARSQSYADKAVTRHVDMHVCTVPNRRENDS